MKITTILEDDEELLRGIVQADPIQVKKLYAHYLPAVIRHVKDNSGSEEEARDIFQDAVMVVYKKITQEGLELEVPFKSWLLAVCKNMWLSRLRYKKGKQIRELSEVVPDPEPIIMNRLEKVQIERVFYKHFGTLGGNCREILQQFFNKVPMKEIAASLNTSEAYIKKRKHHCKEQLIKAVQQDPLYKELRT